MPQINKLEKKKKTFERKDTDMRKLRQQAYQNTAWRKLRDTYMHNHPICEECLNKGKVTPATDIHHMISPFQHGEVNYTLLLDYDNLMALCKECHATLHNNQNGVKTQKQILEELDTLLNNSYNNSDDEN